MFCCAILVSTPTPATHALQPTTFESLSISKQSRSSINKILSRNSSEADSVDTGHSRSANEQKKWIMRRKVMKINKTKQQQERDARWAHYIISTAQWRWWRHLESKIEMPHTHAHTHRTRYSSSPDPDALLRFECDENKWNQIKKPFDIVCCFWRENKKYLSSLLCTCDVRARHNWVLRIVIEWTEHVPYITTSDWCIAWALTMNAPVKRFIFIECRTNYIIIYCGALK